MKGNPAKTTYRHSKMLRNCWVQMCYLGDGFKHFLFSPLPGEDSHFDDHIFQRGWFNHQLGYFGAISPFKPISGPNQAQLLGSEDPEDETSRDNGGQFLYRLPEKQSNEQKTTQKQSPRESLSWKEYPFWPRNCFWVICCFIFWDV